MTKYRIQIEYYGSTIFNGTFDATDSGDGRSLITAFYNSTGTNIFANNGYYSADNFLITDSNPLTFSYGGVNITSFWTNYYPYYNLSNRGDQSSVVGLNDDGSVNQFYTDMVFIISMIINITGSAPTSVTASVASSTSIKISYGASTGGTPAVSAYYYTLNGGSYTSASASPFTISGLSTGVTYSVVMYAYNESWPTQYVASSSSNSVTITTAKYSIQITYYGGLIFDGTFDATDSGNGRSLITAFYDETGTNIFANNDYYSADNLLITADSNRLKFSNNGVNVTSLSNWRGEPYYNLSTDIDFDSRYYDNIVGLYENGGSSSVWDVEFRISMIINTTGSAPSIISTIPSTNSIIVSFNLSTGGIPALPTTTPTDGMLQVNGYYYSINAGVTKYNAGISSPITISGLNSNTLYNILIYAYHTSWPTQFSAAATTSATTLGIVESSYYFASSTDLTSKFPTLLNSSSNNVPNAAYLTNLANPINKCMLYTYGTRDSVGFKIDGNDIGVYFQQDSITRAIEVGAYNIGPWGVSQSNLSNSKWIWNAYNAASSDIPANVYIWFYYTFYYSGTQTSGTLYASVDNVGVIHFNGDRYNRFDIYQPNSSGSPTNAVTVNTVSVKNGFNYIKACAYNQGGPAGFIMSIVAGGSQIANTNSDWTLSTSASYNTGANQFIFLPNEEFYVYLLMSGLVYYTGSPFQISNYITGSVPPNTTYSPSSFTAQGTYSFSNITVNLPTGYVLSPTSSGTFTIASGQPTNLTLSGTTYYLAGTNTNAISSPSVEVSSLVTSSPSVIVTYSPTNFTTSGLITSLSGITPSFPSGYLLGTVSGTASIIPYLDFTTTTGSAVSIPSWCKKVAFVVQMKGNNSVQTAAEYPRNVYDYVQIGELWRGLSNLNYYDYNPNWYLRPNNSILINVGQIPVIRPYSNFIDMGSNPTSKSINGAHIDLFYRSMRNIHYTTPNPTSSSGGNYVYASRYGAAYNYRVTGTTTTPATYSIGTGGTCYSGNYNVTTGGATAMTIVNNSSIYIQFNSTGNPTVPTTATGGNLIYTTISGSEATPGSQNGITIPSGATNILSSYGTGGTNGGSGVSGFIRVWFLPS